MIFRNKTVNEELLVPIARYLRYRRVIPLLPKNRPLHIIDFGCDPEFSFYNYCLAKGVKIERYTGVDPLLNKNLLKKQNKNKKINLIKNTVEEANNLKPNSYDFSISLALLEHLVDPSVLILKALKSTKKGGKFIFTTPTPLAKPILETLSFRLNLLSPESIADHKNYFKKDDLSNLVKEHKVKFSHKYFDFGVNNLVVLTKKQ